MTAVAGLSGPPRPHSFDGVEAVETIGGIEARSLTRRAQLCLLGGPYVQQGSRRIAVPESSKRLLVFVALHEGRVDRRYAAGTLWPLGDDDRAAGNLRSALWRLKRTGIEIVRADKCALWLDPHADFDVRTVDHWAGRIIEGEAGAEDLRMPRWGTDAMDLLPGWYDDWVIFERERLRQRLLHALEALSRMLVQAQRYAQAIEVALEAVRVEPLRESAHRTLLEAHLAEGNLVEARRIFCEYWALVRRELGVEPDPALAALVEMPMPRATSRPLGATISSPDGHRG
jgi:DNA-binding SARP family transcriptional activator